MEQRSAPSTYATSCGKPYCRNEEWLQFFGAIADRIAADINPRRVLDAGCALGLLVETLRARGMEAFGVDISSYAIAHAEPGTRPYLREGVRRRRARRAIRPHRLDRSAGTHAGRRRRRRDREFLQAHRRRAVLVVSGSTSARSRTSTCARPSIGRNSSPAMASCATSISTRRSSRPGPSGSAAPPIRRLVSSRTTSVATRRFSASALKPWLTWWSSRTS